MWAHTRVPCATGTDIGEQGNRGIWEQGGKGDLIIMIIIIITIIIIIITIILITLNT
jgi:hypothetical protein